MNIETTDLNMEEVFSNAKSGKGGLYICEIAHDDWCAHWKGGECNCDSKISYKKIKTK